jgi:hypothetical protein
MEAIDVMLPPPEPDDPEEVLPPESSPDEPVESPALVDEPPPDPPAQPASPPSVTADPPMVACLRKRRLDWLLLSRAMFTTPSCGQSLGI